MFAQDGILFEIGDFVGFFSFSFSLSTGSGVGGCSKEGIFVRCSCVVVWLRMTRWCVKEQRFQELDESWM